MVVKKLELPRLTELDTGIFFDLYSEKLFFDNLSIIDFVEVQNIITLYYRHLEQYGKLAIYEIFDKSYMVIFSFDDLTKKTLYQLKN